MVGKGYLDKFIMSIPLVSSLGQKGSRVSDELQSFLGGRGEDASSQIYLLSLGKEGECRELFLFLLLLNCLQLSITNMPKWHFEGRHMLLPFKSLLVTTVRLRFSPILTSLLWLSWGRITIDSYKFDPGAFNIFKHHLYLLRDFILIQISIKFIKLNFYS